MMVCLLGVGELAALILGDFTVSETVVLVVGGVAASLVLLITVFFGYERALAHNDAKTRRH